MMSLTALRKIVVAKDGEKPCAKIGARLEAFEVAPGLQERFLHEIIRMLAVAAKGNGERADIGYQSDQRLSELKRIKVVWFSRGHRADN